MGRGTGARIAEVRIITVEPPLRGGGGHYQITAVEYVRKRGELVHQHLGGRDVEGTEDEAEEAAQHVKDTLLGEGFDEVHVRSI